MEICLTIPAGFELVGVRTKGDKVVVVIKPGQFQPQQTPRRKRVGFVQESPAGNKEKKDAVQQ